MWWKKQWRSLRSEKVTLSLYVGKKLNEYKNLLEKLMQTQIACVKIPVFLIFLLLRQEIFEQEM
jgi:hypothetical protein